MSAHIHHGPWINWSRGLIRGATVTLGEREGGLLTAFIATFVTIVGAELWKIICYILHQTRSVQGPQDGLHHQQQVILRTSPTPGGAAWLFLQQTWSWAGKARLAVLRTLPWSMFSVAYILAFGVMAIFSSEISKSPGPQRLLIAPDACGIWALNSSSPDVLNALRAKTLNNSNVAATYARACYGGSNDPLQCSKLPVSALKYNVDRNATCPFQSGICTYGDTAAFSMTTGMINSHLDLGINAPEEHRIQVEKSTTCAPVRAKDYFSIVNATNENGLGRINDEVILYNFGPMVQEDGNFINYTYYYNTHASIDQSSYSLSAYSAIAGANQSEAGSFIPCPALQIAHADLSLLFISSNSLTYQTIVDDPVFGAHHLMEGNVLGGEARFYSADLYVTVVGCSEQFRACNPLNNVCTPRLGFGQLQEALFANNDGMQLNDVQNATWKRLMGSLQLSSVYYATYARAGSALRANEVVSTLSSGYLPPDQWHIEASSWFDAGLALVQQKVQEYATGPASIVSGSYVVPPNRTLAADAPWVDFCYSQLVNDSSDTMSFSVLGLVLLLGIGGVIICISLIIDSVVGYIQHKTGRGLHARMEWMTNDRLQMQRLLFSYMKLGQWTEDPSEKVPTTVKRGDKFVGVADTHGEEITMDERVNDGYGSDVHIIQEYGQSKAYQSI